MKVERERRLQHEAELQEKEQEKRRRIEEEEIKEHVIEMNKRQAHQLPAPILDKKHVMDPKKRLEILLENAIPKSSAVSIGTSGTTPSKQDQTHR